MADSEQEKERSACGFCRPVAAMKKGLGQEEAEWGSG